MADDFEPGRNLFGELLPPNWGMRGRPQHVRTDENAGKIMHGLTQGWPDKRIAAALGVSVPTMKRYYFSLLKMRDVARDRVELAAMHRLWVLGQEGSTAAMKEYLRRFDSAASTEFADRTSRAVEAVGKKEQLRIEAANPPDEWENVTPRLVN